MSGGSCYGPLALSETYKVSNCAHGVSVHHRGRIPLAERSAPMPDMTLPSSGVIYEVSTASAIHYLHHYLHRCSGWGPIVSVSSSEGVKAENNTLHRSTQHPPLTSRDSLQSPQCVYGLREDAHSAQKCAANDPDQVYKLKFR